MGGLKTGVQYVIHDNQGFASNNNNGSEHTYQMSTGTSRSRREWWPLPCFTQSSFSSWRPQRTRQRRPFNLEFKN